jgi:flagellin
MPAVLNTNTASLYASKNLQNAQSKMANSVERLSSGLRINRAKDDAAGLGIAQSLTSQINASNQGIRNLNDGVSMVQAAEGAIAAAVEMGQRILTLATQGANGSQSQAGRDAIKSEMQQLLIAITGISSRTNYSGISLLDASTGTASATLITLQSSNVSSDTVTLKNDAFRKIGAGDVTKITVGGSDASGQASALSNQIFTTSSQANMLSTVSAANDYITALNTQRSLLGAYQNQIEFTVSNITELSSNLSAARSNVQDTDYATETAALTKGQILQQAATAMLAQANQMPNVILSLLK